MTKADTFQGLMNRAYDRWQARPADDRWSKEQFWEQLSGDELLAVPLGNMIYQVQNGGFDQWRGNGYAEGQSLDMLRATLRLIGTTEARETLRLVDQFMQTREPDDDDDIEEYSSSVDVLSTAFYKLDDALLAQAETFFAGRMVAA